MLVNQELLVYLVGSFYTQHITRWRFSGGACLKYRTPSTSQSPLSSGSDCSKNSQTCGPGNILAGPPQVAKTLLTWQHNYKRCRQHKRKISYQEQIRYMTGERDPLSPMTKKARLLEIMDYLSDPAGVAEAICNIPTYLEDSCYQDLGATHMQLEDWLNFMIIYI